LDAVELDEEPAEVVVAIVELVDTEVNDDVLGEDKEDAEADARDVVDDETVDENTDEVEEAAVRTLPPQTPAA
jgi:hypothetical protein